MIPTIEFATETFRKFNAQMFAGRLPEIPIELTRAETFMGKFVFKVNSGAGKLPSYSDFRLRVSVNFDLPREMWEDVMIHEMIHYFVKVNGLHDAAPHGMLFRALMQSINKAHGRHITVSARHDHGHTDTDTQSAATATSHSSAQSTTQSAAQSGAGRGAAPGAGTGAEAGTTAGRGERGSGYTSSLHGGRWCVVAAIRFENGSMGMKVLPRTMHSIVNYYNKAMQDRKIVEIRLYLHDNPFFERYPKSGSLNFHEIDAQLLENNLADGRPLKIVGDEVEIAG